MKIGVIQASSQKEKNKLIFESVRKAVEPYGYEVINFGVFEDMVRFMNYSDLCFDARSKNEIYKKIKKVLTLTLW